jgi:hypothetical protein
VLVIIGLLVGGVLVGQDLIIAARLRATTSQVIQFKTAANTFRLKYNALPGDIAQKDATAFGLPARTSGDNDGLLIGGSSGGPVGWSQGQETTMFWVDLSAAGLIAGSFTLADGSIYSFTQPDIPKLFPTSKLRPTTYWSVMSFNGANYYILSAIGPVTSGPPSYTYYLIDLNAGYGAGLTSYEASVLDQKMDDGQPLSGSVTIGAQRTGITNNTVPTLAIPWNDDGANCAVLGNTYSVLHQTTYYICPALRVIF